jgi:serine/threonine protein kinase
MDIDDSYLGKQIGNYVLTKVLGGGTFGTVYLAEHTYLNRTVAIKVLNHIYSHQQEDRDTFFKEAKFLDILQHRHILPIIDAGIQDKMLYIMIEYAPDGSLRERIDHQRPALLPMREALLILSQIGQALHYAHLHNIVHK